MGESSLQPLQIGKVLLESREQESSDFFSALSVAARCREQGALALPTVKLKRTMYILKYILWWIACSASIPYYLTEYIPIQFN